MKQLMLTLSLLLCCFASAGAKAQRLSSDIDRVEIAVSSNWDPMAANVGRAFADALRMSVEANVHFTDMDVDRFHQFLYTAGDPQPMTLKISIVSVDPTDPLPSYTEGLELIGAVAEEPLAIFEATHGRLEREIQRASIRNAPLRVGVFDSGTEFIARTYFGQRGIPIDSSYEDDLATPKVGCGTA